MFRGGQTKEQYQESLFRLAEALYNHLEYCGWGDSWERECSEDLRRKAQKFFEDE